jgi:hypothetical protein
MTPWIAFASQSSPRSRHPKCSALRKSTIQEIDSALEGVIASGIAEGIASLFPSSQVSIAFTLVSSDCP